jgi:hypothetical protein
MQDPKNIKNSKSGKEHIGKKRGKVTALSPRVWLADER